MAPARLSLKAALDDLEHQFDLSTEDLNAILKRFRDRMDYGLKHDGQDMAMIPSFGMCRLYKHPLEASADRMLQSLECLMVLNRAHI